MTHCHIMVILSSLFTSNNLERCKEKSSIFLCSIFTAKIYPKDTENSTKVYMQ